MTGVNSSLGVSSIASILAWRNLSLYEQIRFGYHYDRHYATINLLRLGNFLIRNYRKRRDFDEIKMIMQLKVVEAITQISKGAIDHHRQPIYVEGFMASYIRGAVRNHVVKESKAPKLVPLTSDSWFEESDLLSGLYCRELLAGFDYRDRCVIEDVSAGFNNAEIGRRLNLSREWVRRIRDEICRKIGP